MAKNSHDISYREIKLIQILLSSGQKYGKKRTNRIITELAIEPDERYRKGYLSYHIDVEIDSKYCIDLENIHLNY